MDRLFNHLAQQLIALKNFGLSIFFFKDNTLIRSFNMISMSSEFLFDVVFFIKSITLSLVQHGQTMYF
jgi:hypothetical protein